MWKVVRGHLDCWEYQPCINHGAPQSTSFPPLNSAVAFPELKGHGCWDTESEGQEWRKPRLVIQLEANLGELWRSGKFGLWCTHCGGPLRAFETRLCCEPSGARPEARLQADKWKRQAGGDEGCSGQGTGPEDWVKTTGLTVETMFGGMVTPWPSWGRSEWGRAGSGLTVLCRSSSPCLAPKFDTFMNSQPFIFEVDCCPSTLLISKII